MVMRLDRLLVMITNVEPTSMASRSEACLLQRGRHYVSPTTRDDAILARHIIFKLYENIVIQ